jgi:DNA-binding CsgD family transcriptional regulator
VQSSFRTSPVVRQVGQRTRSNKSLAVIAAPMVGENGIGILKDLLLGRSARGTASFSAACRRRSSILRRLNPMPESSPNGRECQCPLCSKAAAVSPAGAAEMGQQWTQNSHGRAACAVTPPSPDGGTFEILEVVAEGLDNHEIAARLDISEKTVRNHVSTIVSKLQLRSPAQAVALARDAGYGRRAR